MSYKDSIAAISSRELKTAPAAVPSSHAGYGSKGTGVAYGLVYLVGVFAFSIAVSKGGMKGMKGMKR